jgi:hypothetical protein
MSYRSSLETGSFTENLGKMEPIKNPMADPDQYQLQNCHSENQRWAVTLKGYEQEIDQLQALLDDVLEHYNYQNLRPRAIDYHQSLNRLKLWFNRLRTDLICDSSNCVSGNRLPCEEPRFGRYTAIPAQFAGLSDEFARTKAGCYQFLTVLVQLNLL